MFAGRVGPLTLAVAFGEKQINQSDLLSAVEKNIKEEKENE